METTQQASIPPSADASPVDTDLGSRDFGEWVERVGPFGPALAILALQPIVLGMPLGVWIFGLIVGLLAALVAAGMSLIYRANRIVNFAQADLGSVPMSLAYSAVIVGGLGYLLGALLGLVTAVLLGAAVDRLIVRRFFTAPRLLLTVASIGISQLLIVIALAIPFLVTDRNLSSARLSPPFDVSINIGNQVFRSADLLALIVAPLALAALAVVLRYTDIGMAVRASADRADRARMLGVPVLTLNTVTWALAAVLSFIGVFLRAGISGLPLGFDLSLPALVLALGALVMGRMDNLPAITASAVALGVLERAVNWQFPNTPNLTYPVVGAAILVALLARRDLLSRRDTETASSWRASEEARPVPAELARLPEVLWGRVALAAITVLGLVVLPTLLSESNIFRATQIVAYALVALSVVVLTGWTGQISLGQMGFAAVGGAVSAYLTFTAGLPLLLALPLAGLAGSAAAVIIGIPALRLRGLILAITTLAFALSAAPYLFNRTVMGWIPSERLDRGSLGPIDLQSQRSMYYFTLVVVGLLFLGVAGIRRSPVGRRMLAVRDNEKAAAAFATNIVSAKLMAFCISGFLAAVGGALISHLNQSYTELPFVASESLTVFTAAVIGGVTSLAGAALGAVYLLGLTWFVVGLFGAGGPWTLLPSAAGVLFVLMLFPGGLGNLLVRVRDSILRNVAANRGITVPSLLGEPPSADAGLNGDGSATTPATDDEPDPSTPTPAPTPTPGRGRRRERDHDETIDLEKALDPVLPNRSGATVPSLQPLAGAATGLTPATAGAPTTPPTADSSSPTNGTPDPGQPAGSRSRPTGTPMLEVRNLDVGYGDVQILFGVDLEVHEGEIVALLGTNGAGKSTLLRAISSVADIQGGSVLLQGQDITYHRPEDIAARGVAQLPGGQAIFPSLTVRENLQVAGWMDKGDDEERKRRIDDALALFPMLTERLDSPAANLSGGQQQQLALGMVFLTRPKLLMIDELSLGLAPIVVEQLLETVNDLRRDGTTILLVEQSVNVALNVADRAYFLEKGQVRFEGPTAELLERPDIVRSVFLEGAADIESPAAVPAAAPGGAPVVPLEPAPPLVVSDVSVDFGGVRAVDRVSLEVAPGEVVGLIGPNGAGKTTLFDVISGFTPAVDGSVVLGDEDLTSASPHVRAIAGIGRSFQDARLFGSLTVEENIQVAVQRWLDVQNPFSAALRLPNFVMSEAYGRDKSDELIELLGLGSFRDRFVSELSTGSRRMVDLACILALEPTIVLLDEPSSGIAQKEAEALVPLVAKIKTHLGASVLVIEHDMSLITKLADRLVALESGRVIASGTADEVLSDGAVVSSYLGTDNIHRQRTGAMP